ncbi:alpha/beta-hydrolase family protein [Citricoccus sp. GCM10030269]|uniref:alpha/beta-hydrolase family protein n=1 Tax=Citricoccus sp. GCM10030269 TaxID=3273388 RepID=UPI003622B428
MRLRPDAAGVIGAHVMSWVSLSPSFIPRTWWMTSVAMGISQSLGYFVGAAGRTAARGLGRAVGVSVTVDQEKAAPVVRAVPWVMFGISGLSWLHNLRAQAEIAGLMETRPIRTREHLVGVLGGLVLTTGLVSAGRGVNAIATSVSRGLKPLLPEPVAAVVGISATATGTAFVLDKVVYRRLLERLSKAAQETNAKLLPGRVPPVEPERSGSEASYEAWGTLGSKGQAVVSDGPRAVDIEEATGQPAMTPIRAYAGWREGRDLEATAAAVVAELHRTGGFEREVLLMLTTTGTGWLQEWSASSVEFLTGGNCALAAMQYTYLPSGVAFFADRTTPVLAASVLLSAIEAELEKRPPERRPQLLVGGESLGALGGTQAFDGLEDMIKRVDGAVWSGLPRFSDFWQSLVPFRRRGTPEVAPVVDDGRHVRFATKPEDLLTDITGVPFGEWRYPRIVVAQHASDPVVWWSPDLLWREPDWAKEKAGLDVSRYLQWQPWVTFWQVASDMPQSVSVPGGHGHRYVEDMLQYWAAVLGKDPLTDLSKIAQAIRRTIVPNFA